MFWNRISLTGKLFAIIAATVLLVIVIITSAVAVNMRSGFTNYLLTTEMGRLGGLQEALIEHSGASEGWPTLAEPSAWRNLVASNLEIPPPRPRPQEFALPPTGTEFEPRRPPPPRGPSPLRAQDRLTLLDASGRHVAGSTVAGDVAVNRVLQSSAGAELGTLVLHAPQNTGAPADQVFVASQLRSLLLIVLLATAIAGLAAWFAARQFLRPIGEIADGIGRLVSGDFSTRLEVQRGDALGRLMMDHNTLAASLERNRDREREWISDTSHELKTPLALLRAEIEALQDGVRQASPTVLASLHGSTMRLSRLVSDLNLTTSGAGAVMNTVDVIDVCQIAQEAADAMRSRAMDLCLDLKVVAPSAILVRADPERMRQIFDNLLENACRYTNAPGRIDIHCSATNGSACITVEDSAPCPPADAMPRLFNRFYRVEASRARNHGGSGLGLAICQSLIMAHGGTISAEQSQLGGLNITMRLPAIERNPDA